MRIFTALLSGLLFGIGLIVSGMSNPAKVLAFLDLAGHWDPSLALVMVGAIIPSALAFRFKRQAPATGGIDRRLILGSLAFGAGWGLAGYCPGPAIASIATFTWQPIVFVLAMLAGMGIYELSVYGLRRTEIVGS
ncbi:MAG: DUF6691 family protein [Pseudomonadota bacterium]